MKLFGWYFKSSLLVRILIGLIAGAICGLVFGPAMAWVSPFGEIFIRLLKMIVMPVIFLTSKDEEIDEVIGLRMGADDYMTKPVDAPTIRRVLSRWLDDGGDQAGD